MRSRGWFWLLSAVALLSGLTGFGAPASSPPPASGRAQAAGRVLRYEAAETVTVAPCCEPLPIAPPLAPRGEAEVRVWEPPEGRFLPDEAMERVRLHNRWSRDVPRGRRLGVAARVGAVAPALEQKIGGLDQVDSYAKSPSFFWAMKPPDTIGAASSNKIVQATNSAILLMDRDGGSRTIQRANAHFGVSVDDEGNGILFDPKVRYDAASGRYFLVYLFRTTKPKKSFIYLSVSRGEPNSLTSGWCNYKIKGKIGGTWADYEGVGFSRNLFVLATNNFTFSDSFKTTMVWVADMQALVNNADACPKVKFSRVDMGAWGTVRPAQDLDASSPDMVYMVNSDCCGTSSTDVRLFRVLNSARTAGAVAAIVEGVALTGTTYGAPPTAPQKNSASEFDTGDARVTQAVLRAGVVYATHATVCQVGPTPNESCVRTIEIAPASPLAASTIVGQATLAAGRNRYVWWPGIMVNAAGDVVSVAQFGGNKRYLSTAYAVRAGSARARGGAGFSKYKILAKGVRESLCGAERNRTGDYTMAAVAPDDATFLVGGQFADKKGKVDSFDEDCAWSTRIGVLR